MHVVAVLFTLHPAHRAAFRTAILTNAEASRSTEPGCLRFDVAFDDDGTRCFLFELYTDPAAFDTHHASAHFKAFQAATAGMVADKRVETYTLVE